MIEFLKSATEKTPIRVGTYFAPFLKSSQKDNSFMFPRGKGLGSQFGFGKVIFFLFSWEHLTNWLFIADEKKSYSRPILVGFSKSATSKISNSDAFFNFFL